MFPLPADAIQEGGFTKVSLTNLLLRQQVTHCTRPGRANKHIQAGTTLEERERSGWSLGSGNFMDCARYALKVMLSQPGVDRERQNRLGQ